MNKERRKRENEWSNERDGRRGEDMKGERGVGQECQNKKWEGGREEGGGNSGTFDGFRSYTCFTDYGFGSDQA